MKKIYVKNEDNFIYEVKCEVNNIHESCNTHTYNLQLIAGWDYINENTDVQGYVSNDRFVKDIQHEWVVCWFIEESLKECLLSNDYEIIEKLPKIH